MFERHGLQAAGLHARMAELQKGEPVIRLSSSTLLHVGLLCSSMAAQAPKADQRAMENHLATGLALTQSSAQKWNVNDRMKALHVHGASVAVIHQGAIEWAAGYGDRQTDGPAVDTSTVFNFALVSKAVTAVAVMRLAQDGRLDSCNSKPIALEAMAAFRTTIGWPRSVRTPLSS